MVIYVWYSNLLKKIFKKEILNFESLIIYILQLQRIQDFYKLFVDVSGALLGGSQKTGALFLILGLLFLSK